MSDMPRFDPVRATVSDYGGGRFTAHVDRDTMQYPSGDVVVVPEELWDRMLRPLEWQPGSVYSHPLPTDIARRIGDLIAWLDDDANTFPIQIDNLANIHEVKVVGRDDVRQRLIGILHDLSDAEVPDLQAEAEILRRNIKISNTEPPLTFVVWAGQMAEVGRVLGELLTMVKFSGSGVLLIPEEAVA